VNILNEIIRPDLWEVLIEEKNKELLISYFWDWKELKFILN
jgi:hypothetical protein